MRSTCMPPSSAIKMATFNAKSFEKKLNAMDLSQTSIQTVSLWIIHHRQSIREIVAVWIEMMKKGNDLQRSQLSSCMQNWKLSGKMAHALVLLFTAITKPVWSLHVVSTKLALSCRRCLK